MENRKRNQSCREGHVTLPKTACAPVQEVRFNMRKTAFVTGTVLQIQTAVQEGFDIKKTAFVTGTVLQIQTSVDAPMQEEGLDIKKTIFVTGTVLQIQTAVDAPMEEEYDTGKTAIITGICKPTTKDDHANTGEQ